MLDAHGDWAVSSVSQICTLNVMIAARNTPTEASAPYPHASEGKLLVFACFFCAPFHQNSLIDCMV
jgi:hypothetical protein